MGFFTFYPECQIYPIPGLFILPTLLFLLDQLQQTFETFNRHSFS